MNEENLTAEIRALVQEILQQNGDTQSFDDDESLLLSGRLSSLNVLLIATQLEQKYHINFNVVGFDQYMFDTVSCIVNGILLSGS